MSVTAKETPQHPGSGSPPAPSPARTLTSSTIGSVIEWYDFTVYGTAAALLFDKLFFSSVSPATGTLASFATFAVGFIARPLGGLIAGHYGDRLGRKATMVVTLTVMGIATTLIGALPTFAQVGVWAPVLLLVLRVCQGLAVGGEWGGAALLAVEHAPPRRRGLYGAWPQTGVSAGLLLGTGAFSLVTLLPEEQLMSWGWRLPFLISVVLAAFGFYMRYRLTESESFKEVTQETGVAKMPLVEAVRTHGKEILIAFGVRFAEGGNYYLISTFVLAYLTTHLGMDQQDGLTAEMVAAAVNIAVLPLWGALSDRVGRKPVFLFGAVFMALYAVPFFWLLDTRSPLLVTLALVVMLGIPHGAVYAPLSAFYAELFTPRVRYSGMSIGYQAGSVLLGGFTPLIAASLLETSHVAMSVAAMIAAGAVIAAAAMSLAPETYRRPLEGHGAVGAEAPVS